MHKRAVVIIEATFGLVSNNSALLNGSEFFHEARDIQSLLTNVHEIAEINYGADLDAYLYLIDEPDLPVSVDITDRRVWINGDLTRLDRKRTDRRYSIFGNLGLFFSYALATLERFCHIYSFHASALFRPEQNDLLIILGSAGAGKTVYLLEGIARGYRVFSTEMVSFRLDNGRCILFKGSLYDNIRVGNLSLTYPEAALALGIEVPTVADVWRTKIAVDMRPVSVQAHELVNPNITLVFPRIEEGRKTAIVDEITQPERLVKLLFDSATEKVCGTTLLYGEVPVLGFDSCSLMQARLAAVSQFVCGGVPHISRAVSLLAGPTTCMEGL